MHLDSGFLKNPQNLPLTNAGWVIDFIFNKFNVAVTKEIYTSRNT